MLFNVTIWCLSLFAIIINDIFVVLAISLDVILLYLEKNMTFSKCHSAIL